MSERGNMDVKAHQETYSGFIKASIYSSAAMVIIMVIMALTLL